MAKLNDLEDVTISNPKAGDVVKYTATGWTNAADATGSAPGGNPCGNLDDYTHKDKPATITEPWTWETDDKCGVIVKNQDGVNQLDEYARVCPGRVEVGNNNGRGELKTFDGGSTRLSAFDNQLSFYDVNNPDGVTLAELVACCDTDSGGGTGGSNFDPVAVNFPAASVFTYQHSGRATSVDPDGTGDPDWTSTDLYDIFDRDSNQQVVEMPAGSNAAVMVMSFGITIRPWSGVKESTTGYCNAGLEYVLESNKPNLISSPGKLASGVRVFGDILGWNQGASSIGGGDETLRKQRSPSNSASGIKMVRVYFEESTTDSPTRIIIKPDGVIHRIRGCEVSVGSGRCLIIPYHDDGTNWKPRIFSAIDEDEFEDDGGVEKELAERMESVDLKNRMNYMSNAIRETLDYDEGLDPAGIPILEQALKDIFGLKREQINNVEYYQNRLDTITELVMPYVGFQFGFETVNTVRSF